jgi:hypothetical protein
VEKAVLTGQGEQSDAAQANASAAAPVDDDATAADATAATAAVATTATTTAAVTTATAAAAAADSAAADTAAAEAAAGRPLIPDDPAVAVPGAGAVPVTPEAATAEVQARARAPRWANLPYTIVLIAAAGGLSWVALGGLRHVQAGMTTVASALLAAAVLRLVLPERAAGLLVSRRRVLDVLALASLGAGIMAAVLVLPMP